HAIETYVTTRRNAVSLLFSREAWRLLEENFCQVLEEPKDLEARSGMQLGSCFAGLAIENSMLGATHALANPLTAEYGIVHGQAISMMLPHVIRFNGVDYAHWYRELLEAIAGSNGAPPPSSGAEGLADLVSKLAARAELPMQLSQCDVERSRLRHLAESAAQQWTATFNPRKVTTDDLLELYKAAF
ncbi:MAG TPA: iron-containing alcohol dehydrogenase, partial [Pirellulales bacterium]|nr:iron-containing alcohol dehydrogenase [Pirellulales bacterium]